MTRHPFFAGISLATASLLTWPAAPLLAIESDSSPAGISSTLLARGGGGGGGHARTGFGGGGSFTRGDKRPSGGFSGGDRLNRVGNPSISRPSARPVGGLERPGGGVERPDGGGNLGDRTGRLGDRNLNLNREGDRAINVDRDWNRQVNIGDINLNPGWARPGWGVARPWNWGWYGGWSNPPWGWWGASAAAWGIGSLASAAIINNAVNDAVYSDVSYIMVPNTAYQLRYGTIQPYGNNSLSFVVTANGTSYQLTADCQAGAINGRQPSSAQEAELLNAVCQVAYGNAT